jgi:CheY-like chemotaxis protein
MLTGIFDLFTQIVPAGEQSPRGMGIGLTVVRDLIEMHGGVVNAASAGLGQGSEFVVRLPSSQVERAAPAGQQDGLRDPGEPLAPHSATGLRVLVVDDNASSVRSLTALLRCWGYTTESTADPFTAPQIADWFEPEVVLLDIGMPCLSGLELGKQLRARLPEVRLVAITGHGQEEDRQRSLENGFECHFVKPVDPLELAQFLATVRPTAI